MWPPSFLGLLNNELEANCLRHTNYFQKRHELRRVVYSSGCRLLRAQGSKQCLTHSPHLRRRQTAFHFDQSLQSRHPVIVKTNMKSPSTQNPKYLLSASCVPLIYGTGPRPVLFHMSLLLSYEVRTCYGSRSAS